MSSAFKYYEHNCTDAVETVPPRQSDESCFYRLKKFWFSLTLVSSRNCETIKHFRSQASIRNEQRRHYYSKNFFMIHPLSVLAAIYDAFLCVFYFCALFFKTIDVAFIRENMLSVHRNDALLSIVQIINIMTYVHIFSLCFYGVILKDKTILIDFREVIIYRLTSFIFWANLMSSIPRNWLCKRITCDLTMWLVLNTLRITILCLSYKPIQLLTKSLLYFRVRSRTVIIIFHMSYLMLFMTHLMACMGFIIPKYRLALHGKFKNDTWLVGYENLVEKEITVQYAFSFFRASAQMFGIAIDEYRDTVWEERLMSMVTYSLGKITNIVMWAALLHVLLSANLQSIRFQEIMTQLRTWMDNKDLPGPLQKRIVDYYKFYYQNKYFNMDVVERVLPASLGFKMRINMYKTLRASNVELFKSLSDDALHNIGDHMIGETYSPKDVIIYAGTIGHSFYLVASGTVAIYSQSGKELCHLQDGGYFGELALLMKRRKVLGTVVALETTEVYRLERDYFEKFVLTKNHMRRTFMLEAQRRIESIRKVEDEYRNDTFPKTYNM